MKQPLPSTNLPRALRNASILAWWTCCSPSFRTEVTRAYAVHLGNCPLDEIDEDMIGADDLDWLSMRYGNVINLWVNDQL